MSYHIRFDDGRWFSGGKFSDKPTCSYSSIDAAIKAVNDYRFQCALFAPDAPCRTMDYSLIPESDLNYWIG